MRNSILSGANLAHTHMMRILQSLRGKRTYIIAILMVVLGLLQGDATMVLQGLGFAGLRAGLPQN